MTAQSLLRSIAVAGNASRSKKWNMSEMMKNEQARNMCIEMMKRR